MDLTIQPLRILVVEDNPLDVRLIIDVLRRSDFKADINVAKDGVEAMAYLCQRAQYGSAARADVVLLDLNLPKKSGMEVLKEIKSNELLRTIPVFVLSGSSRPKEIELAYRHGANLYLQKPLDFDDFIKVGEFIRMACETALFSRGPAKQ